MRVLLQIGLCCLLAAGAGAQRRGGGGGFHGGAAGGFHGGGGFVGGGFRVGSGFVGGFGGYSSPYRYGYPWYGSSYYYPGYYDYSPYISTSPYISNYAYPAYDYNVSPNVTVVYAQQPAPAPAAAPVPAPVYTNVAAPSGHTYDQYGQEVKPPESSNAAPIYLVAMKDHTIYAAAAYWMDGKTLHYVTLQHQEKQAPLDQVDRGFSQQLNRERGVAFHLPAE
jgi:hypothetical protein